LAAWIDELSSRRFLVVMGKGGVGKTTLAAAIALTAAEQGKKVWLVESAHSESLAAQFGLAPVGHEPTKIRQGLFISNLDARGCFRSYASRVLGSRTLTNLLFQNKLVELFVDALPGFDSALLLYEMLAASDPKLQKPKDRFDLVIFDAPATGHGVNILSTPATLREMVRSGPVFNLCDSILKNLTDPKVAAFVPVTLAEEMPISETCEMLETLNARMSLSWSPIIVNMVTSCGYSEAQLNEARKGWAEDEALLKILQRELAHANLNSEALARLRARSGRDIIALPRISALAGASLSSRQEGPTPGLGELVCHLKNS
jgi:anion-transporting  ArsA/GET3 family ATPase